MSLLTRHLVSRIPVFRHVMQCVQEELNCLTLKMTALRGWSLLTLATVFRVENIQILSNTFGRCVAGGGQLKCDGTRAETRFGLSAKRPSVQSTAGSRGVRISGGNAGYTMF